MNVLVLGVGGNVSQSIQKALALSTLQIRSIAACISAESTGLYLADAAYISPLAEDPSFIPWLVDICERERVDAVLSGSEVVLAALGAAAHEIHERTGAMCIVSPPEVLETGRDKLMTCRWLKQNGLPTPEFADCADADAVESLVEKCGFPLIAKPRLGKGSDYILTVRDEEDLRAVAATTDVIVHHEHRRNVRGPRDLLLQEFIGDDEHEFTAGCFCDGEGTVRGTIVMRRRLSAGATVAAELAPYPEVRQSAEAIVSALRPLGPCNVQLRLRDGRAIPFEINPRFSGTTAMRARMGFNEVEAALRHFILHESAPALTGAGSGVALRYWNEVYVPRPVFDAMAEDGELSAPQAQVESWGTAR